MVIVTKWDPKTQQEELRNIPNNTSWPIYAQKWKPTWKLRNTKVIDTNL